MQQEAPEADWILANAGVLDLEKGVCQLKISSTDIPRGKSIELKDILMTRVNK